MSEPQIHKAIIAVMREVGAIGKDEKNEQQGYNYRSIDTVYNRVQPLFAKYGIYSYPKVIEQSREIGKTKSGGTMHYALLTVEYTFAADDGSSIAVTVVGEGMDAGDKASNKAMAAAHKYALCQVLNIPYQVIDPDKFTPEWAANLTGGVTVNQLNDLKRAWAAKHKEELAGKDKPDMQLAFGQWVRDTTGESFDQTVDISDFRMWSSEDIERCQEAVK